MDPSRTDRPVSTMLPEPPLRGLTLTRPEGRRETESEAVIATDNARPGPSWICVSSTNQTPIRRHRTEELRGWPRSRNWPGPELSAGRGRRPDGDSRSRFRLSLHHRNGNPDQGMPGDLDSGGNRVREDRLVATPRGEAATTDLGQMIKKNAVRGRIASQTRLGTRRDRQLDARDGHLCELTGGDRLHPGDRQTSSNARGQGFDIHADHVILSQKHRQ